MDVKELQDHSEYTRNQASAILQSTNLLDILKKYGEVHLIGSYPLNVMYGPDIDIIVVSKNIRKSSIDALNEIIEKKLFRKIEYGDFVKFPMEKRPMGYILVLKIVVEKVKWEIEVWFLEDASDQLNYHKLLESKLTEQTRTKILKAKHLRETSNLSKHALSSYEIYKQILE
jgi:hypothetical protein